MSGLVFNYDRVSDLRPCTSAFRAASEMLGGVAAWKAHGFTFREMADAGIPFDDLVWLASAAARNDHDIDRRVRLWVADCAARVLPILERKAPGDTRPRQEIDVGRGLARGIVSDAAGSAPCKDVFDAVRGSAWAMALGGTVRDAAWISVLNAEIAWQLDRLCLWMSEQEPQDWPLSAASEEAAA